MGQRQRLLLVLGLVIGGLAVVAGVDAFNENERTTQLDQYTTQAVQYASMALAWKAQPQATGGGQGAHSLTGLTLEALGFSNVEPRSCGMGTCQGATMPDGSYVFLWDQGSATPHIGISDATLGSDAALVDVTVFVEGPTPDCLRVRTRARPDAGAPWTTTFPASSCAAPW